MANMQTLAIDAETFSSIDLQESGVYPYTEAEDFQILSVAYSIDGGPVRTVGLAGGDNIPSRVVAALTDPGVIKTAFNANFERVCLARHFGMVMPPEQWSCTAVLARSLGLPSTLAEVARVLGLPEDQQKDAAGKALVRYFCSPCKATAKNKGATRNTHLSDPQKWEEFKAYNAQDVRVEMAVRGLLNKFPTPKEERLIWALDQEINDRGVGIDRQLVSHAIACNITYLDRIRAETEALTGIVDIQSVAQWKSWLQRMEGKAVPFLTKATIPELIAAASHETTRQALELRQETSKTSVKKYEAMERNACSDGRIRGSLQLNKSRTGRWASRGVQFQNLPLNKLPDIDLARQLLRDGDYEAIELLFGNLSDVLSQLVRTALVPKPGHRFIVADFSAIEARIIAWLAGETWRMNVFRTHGKIYEASAAQMFHVPVESVTKTSTLRQKGKVAELALGYQGSVQALLKMGALKMGLTETELSGLVDAWRRANPAIVRLWGDLEANAKDALKRIPHPPIMGVQFFQQSGFLFTRLPSGRNLAYVRPRLENDLQFNRTAITFEGVDSTTKQWARQSTYGGKIVENVVQAIARDCLRDALLNVTAAGYDVAFHVHDEIILEVQNGQGSLTEVLEIMGQELPWAPGLPLRAEGFETDYYKKE